MGVSFDAVYRSLSPFRRKMTSSATQIWKIPQLGAVTVTGSRFIHSASVSGGMSALTF